jgi:AraC-like DNA-binding protein
MLASFDFFKVIVTFFLVVTIGQTLMANLILMTNKVGDRYANTFLSLFLFSISLLLSLLYISDFWLYFFPHVSNIHIPVIITLPVFLWFYVQRLTGENRDLNLAYQVLHFIPLLLIIAIMLPYYNLSGSEKMLIRLGEAPVFSYSDTHHWVFTYLPSLKIFMVAQGFIYSYFCYRKLIEHQKKIEHEFSNLERINLRWLKYLLVVNTLIYIMYLLANYWLQLMPDMRYLWLINVVIGCTLITVFSYFGIYQKIIFDNKQNDKNIIDTASDNSILIKEAGLAVNQIERYKSSNLTEEEISDIEKKLTTYMVEKRPYLNPDLSLKQLAEDNAFIPRDLSRVINERFEKNFLEFINNYRIEAAKLALFDGSNKTVLEVAMSVGFNSKSTFYDAFKRVTKTTPTAFKKMKEHKQN